jgi:hypothetical protein
MATRATSLAEGAQYTRLTLDSLAALSPQSPASENCARAKLTLCQAQDRLCPALTFGLGAAEADLAAAQDYAETSCTAAGAHACSCGRAGQLALTSADEACIHSTWMAARAADAKAGPAGICACATTAYGSKACTQASDKLCAKLPKKAGAELKQVCSLAAARSRGLPSLWLPVVWPCLPLSCDPWAAPAPKHNPIQRPQLPYQWYGACCWCCAVLRTHGGLQAAAVQHDGSCRGGHLPGSYLLPG